MKGLSVLQFEVKSNPKLAVLVSKKALFDRALELVSGNQSQAARLLGVTPQAVFKFVRDRD